MEEQTNFPPPNQQNPPTDQNNFPPPGQQNDQNNFPPPSQQNHLTGQNNFPPLGQQNHPTGQNNFAPPGQQNHLTGQNNFPPPGQQIHPTAHNNASPRADHNPGQFNSQPSQNVPPQNSQYQQPQMNQPQYQQPQMGQQYYQQQGQFYQQPVQQMPHQQIPVSTQPMQAGFAMQTAPLNPWSTELFDCAQDMENSIITFFCPCITFGQIAEITDRGMTTCSSTGVIYALLLGFTGFHWIYSWMYRTRMRTQYSLAEDPFHDCLVHFFCEYCAICQEYRELKNRGFNMELGWTGNMQMPGQNQAAPQEMLPMPPPVQGMAR